MEYLTFSGTVIKGSGLGAKELVATANLKPEIAPSQLKAGVYAAFVEFNNNWYHSALFFGHRKSVDKKNALELHLINQDFDLYNVLLKVVVLSKIRDVEHFLDLQSLRNQIKLDLLEAEKICCQNLKILSDLT
jgi:riboflavin kinase/FMN adenylyltransferase